ncbi:MAG: hypothetical protein MAG551_01459 [Candidatus Scalindua arabica]|uniref:Uncharacterized protein n=1 Tax=Candidatus Scalindua arabica TaxID=1127984 RepID=A0A941W5J5_9BACT|nr:hypothetical protein [Candidatus Scalindua arabica]
MAVDRLFLGAFNAKVFGEEIIEKREISFDEILQEEHDKLVQLVSRMEKKSTLEDLCRKYNLEPNYHSPSGE